MLCDEAKKEWKENGKRKIKEGERNKIRKKGNGMKRQTVTCKRDEKGKRYREKNRINIKWGKKAQEDKEKKRKREEEEESEETKERER